MQYFILGILAGLILAASPLLSHTPCISIIPDWSANLKTPEATMPSPVSEKADPVAFPIDSQIIWLTSQGQYLSRTLLAPDTLTALGGNGANYATYRKLGSEIEYFNRAGDRFWKISSIEYPYLSYSGKLVLLLVADLSKILFIDNNGLSIGAGKVSGRTCTSIAFADSSDFAAIGFLEGSFYLVSPKGEIAFTGHAPAGMMIKTIAVSSLGESLAVHYGNADHDGIMTVDVDKNKTRPFALPLSHTTKTALHVSDNGTTAIINQNRMLITNKRGNVIADIPIQTQKPGHAAIHFDGSRYLFTYRHETGGSSLTVCSSNGVVIMNQDFPDESFLDCGFRANRIIARGITSAYSWRLE